MTVSAATRNGQWFIDARANAGSAEAMLHAMLEDNGRLLQAAQHEAGLAEGVMRTHLLRARQTDA